MKFTLILIFAVALFTDLAAQDKAKALLDIYERNAYPYVRDMELERLGGMKDSTDLITKALVTALVQMANTPVFAINKNVISEVRNKQIIDDAVLVALIEKEYKQAFTKLPDEFYIKAKADAKRNHLL